MLPLINIKKDCVNKHHGSVTAAWRVQICNNNNKKKKTFKETFRGAYACKNTLHACKV